MKIVLVVLGLFSVVMAIAGDSTLYKLPVTQQTQFQVKVDSAITVASALSAGDTLCMKVPGENMVKVLKSFASEPMLTVLVTGDGSDNAPFIIAYRSNFDLVHNDGRGKLSHFKKDINGRLLWVEPAG